MADTVEGMDICEEDFFKVRLNKDVILGLTEQERNALKVFILSAFLFLKRSNAMYCW